MSDDVVRWPDRPVTPGRVAVITVSYNTRELTALLLWSLRRILTWGSLEIVVVDNGSADGSAELLAKVDAAGGCRLIANADNAMHGPALTQAMSFLASRRTELPRWVWALDSDVVISRPDALEQALRCAEETNAVVVGESWWDDEHGMDRFEAYSLLLDPARVWRDGIEPFADGGDPAFGLLQSVQAQGGMLCEFPFARDGYLIHRGRSSFSPCGRPATPPTPTTGGPSTTTSRTSLSSMVPPPDTMTCSEPSAPTSARFMTPRRLKRSPPERNCAPNAGGKRRVHRQISDSPLLTRFRVSHFN